jgi:hypothetical protein
VPLPAAVDVPAYLADGATYDLTLLADEAKIAQLPATERDRHV